MEDKKDEKDMKAETAEEDLEVAEAPRGGRYPVILSAVAARYPYSAAREARVLERSDKIGRGRFSTGKETVTGTAVQDIEAVNCTGTAITGIEAVTCTGTPVTGIEAVTGTGTAVTHGYSSGRRNT